MIKGILFDIDGVLVESESLHATAIVESLKLLTGRCIPCQPEKLIGLSLDETLERLGVHRSSTHELKERIADYYLGHLDKSMLRPGIEELWNNLELHNIPFGCVSSAEMRICEGNIRLINPMAPKKIPIISGDCLPQTKPHPLPYRTMLERLKLTAEEVIVLEDSDTGIASARAAGIENVYAWPHALSKSQSYKEAKEVISSIWDVPFIRQFLRQNP